MREDKEPNNGQQEIEHLIPRYIDGALTSEELKQVEEWLEQSPEHQKTVDHFNKITLAVDANILKGNIDTERALIKVKSRAKSKTDIQSKSKNKNFKKSIIFRKKVVRRLERCAALLFIPLVTLAALFLYLSPKTELVSQIKVKTYPGMITTLVLPDSTVVHLNSDSYFEYPSSFASDKREVVLKGEAYFDVTHDTERQFIVKVPHQTAITVYGTCFNVEAYEENKKIITTLVNGEIAFTYNDTNNSNHKIIMKPGQKVVYNDDAKETALYSTNCLSEISWKDGCIVFANTPLKESLRLLEKRYHVEFITEGLCDEEYSFTGTFTHQRLERILEYFRVSSGIHWNYIDDDDMLSCKSRILLYK